MYLFLSWHDFNNASEKDDAHSLLKHRLAECLPLKKLVNEVIKVPCICYISISLPPTQVDVYAHPTKKHVTMLHQDKVLNGIQTALQELVQNQPQSFAVALVQVQVIKNPCNKTKKRKAESQQNVSGTDENRSRPKPSSPTMKTFPKCLKNCRQHHDNDALLSSLFLAPPLVYTLNWCSRNDDVLPFISLALPPPLHSFDWHSRRRRNSSSGCRMRCVHGRKYLGCHQFGNVYGKTITTW
jgi:hypothetical protein